MTPKQTAQTMRITVVSLLLAALLIYPLDWAVWRLRVAAGGGMGQVTVSNVTTASEKGNKTGYYFDGIQTVDCSKSLFPQAGDGACWYLQRHPESVTAY